MEKLTINRNKKATAILQENVLRYKVANAMSNLMFDGLIEVLVWFKGQIDESFDMTTNGIEVYESGRDKTLFALRLKDLKLYGILR